MYTDSRTDNTLDLISFQKQQCVHNHMMTLHTEQTSTPHHSWNQQVSVVFS